MPDQSFFTPNINNSGILEGSLSSQPSITPLIPEGKSFTDRLDNTFKATLKSIGFMSLVLREIDKKQDRAIQLLEIGISANKAVDGKVDKLQETLEEMIDGRKRDKDDADRKRKEEELEKRIPDFTQNTINEEDTQVPDFFTSSLPKLALGVGIAALLADNQKEIAAFLGFIRSTASVVGYLGGTAQGVLTSSRLINPGMVSGFSSAMKSVGGPSVNIATPSTAVFNVLKWLKWLQKAAWFVVLLDPLITAGQAYIFGTNGEPFKRLMSKSFGRVAGGYAGAIWIGKLGALLGAAIGTAAVPGGGTVVGGVFGLVCGAIAGGYYGVEVGEMFGAALYDLLASDLKDWSGFTKIWDKIQNDITAGLDAAAMSVGGAIDSGLKSIGIDTGIPDKKPPSVMGNTPTPSVVPNNVTIQKVSKGTTEVDAMHRAVSAKTGMSLNEMRAIGQIESGNRHDPSIQTGSYQGLYQLNKKGPGDEFDPQVQVDRMSNNILEYKSFFKKYVGREPIAGEIYLLHQQGPTGGTSLVLAYYGGDKYMKAAEGIVKWAKQKIKIQLSVDTIRNHIYSNARTGFIKTKNLVEKAKSNGASDVDKWIGDNITVEEMYVCFITKVNNLVASFEAKDKTASASGDVIGGSMTSVPASMSAIKENINFKPGADKYQAESGTYALANILTEEGLISDRVTGVKDQYHKNTYSDNNTHNQGLAIDFTVAPGTDIASVIKRIKNIAKEAGVNIVVKDFYSKSGGTGKHIHVEFASKADADKFMAYYNNRKSVASPIPQTPNSGENLIKMGSPQDKPKIVVVQQQKENPQLAMNMPQSKPGISGSPPAAYNYNIPAFLNGIF